MLFVCVKADIFQVCVCARACLFDFDVFWILICAFVFCFLTEQKQNNIVADMDMHCLKKVLLAKHGSDIIINHRFLYIFEMCVK